MKYKNLKSVAYSLGHSYMSLMNHTSGDHLNEHLLKIAKQTGKSEINIDFLNEVIEPVEYATDIIMDNLSNYRRYFSKQLESQNCSIEHIKEVKMKILFDLSKITKSKNDVFDYPSYNFTVEILDDRNIRHHAKIPEWYNY